MTRASISLILALVIDIASMTFYRFFTEQEYQDYFYFAGQSISRMLYLLVICWCSQKERLVNILSWTIFPFAIGDVIDCLFFDNTTVSYMEYVALLVATVVFGVKVNKELKKQIDENTYHEQKKAT